MMVVGRGLFGELAALVVGVERITSFVHDTAKRKRRYQRTKDVRE